VHKPIKKFVAASAIALLTAGCAVGPDYQRPATPPVKGYTSKPLPANIASADATGGQSQQFMEGMDIPAQWWTLFHSPSLNLLVERALKANPNLEAACTLAIVEPGTTYHFSGWIKTKTLTTDQGIGFRLRAMGAGNSLPVITAELHGTNSWTFVDQKLTIPAGVFRVQICVKRDPADNPDVRISGNAWVDDVNLVPQSAERPMP